LLPGPANLPCAQTKHEAAWPGSSEDDRKLFPCQKLMEDSLVIQPTATPFLYSNKYRSFPGYIENENSFCVYRNPEPDQSHQQHNTCCDMMLISAIDV